MPISTVVGLGPGDILLDGDPARPPKMAHPQFSVYVCFDQTAGWIKIPLGMGIGFGPGDMVLDGDPAPLTRGTAAPVIGQCVFWPNGCMDRDAT